MGYGGGLPLCVGKTVGKHRKTSHGLEDLPVGNDIFGVHFGMNPLEKISLRGWPGGIIGQGRTHWVLKEAISAEDHVVIIDDIVRTEGLKMFKDV